MGDIDNRFNSLIPVHDENGTAHNIHPDVLLFCAAINDLHSKDDTLFGPREIQDQIREEVKTFISLKEASAASDEETPNELSSPYALLNFISKKFEEYGISPFQDTRIAFIGGSDGIASEQTEYLRNNCANFLDVNPVRNNQSLGLHNWDDYTQDGKFDYVLTGNVLNDPKTPQPYNVFAASGCIAKEGGTVLHALQYSNDNMYQTMNEGLHSLSGQSLNETIMEHGSEHYKAFIALSQEQDRNLSEEHGEWCKTFLQQDYSEQHPIIHFFAENPEFLEDIKFQHFYSYDGELIGRHWEDGSNDAHIANLSDEDALVIIRQFDPNYDFPDSFQPQNMEHEPV